MKKRVLHWGAGRAARLKNQPRLTRAQLVLGLFLVILASFWCFFRSCFSPWFGDRFFMVLTSVVPSFCHDSEIIVVFVFGSLENVILDTPTRKIHGFAFWNVRPKYDKIGSKTMSEKSVKTKTQK